MSNIPYTVFICLSNNGGYYEAPRSCDHIADHFPSHQDPPILVGDTSQFAIVISYLSLSAVIARWRGYWFTLGYFFFNILSMPYYLMLWTSSNYFML
ncbi:hypothetical protein B0H11DRAFT_490387 [Mycena galericulata]|nr:hypothetical protein B0H11DRAFT_490387 [Mycena galericulata]